MKYNYSNDTVQEERLPSEVLSIANDHTPGDSPPVDAYYDYQRRRMQETSLVEDDKANFLGKFQAFNTIRIGE